DQTLLLFAQILKLREDVQANTSALRENQEQVVSLKDYVSGNWVLSKAQEELLVNLLGHWLVKPLQTYEKIYIRVGRYVHLRAQWLHLGVYVTDPLARLAVDKFLQKTIGQMKGAFRKEVVASVKDRKPLILFARTMLEKYHAPVVPNEPPQDTMAALALLRTVASSVEEERRSANEREKSYWPRVEEALNKLYTDFGENRTDAATNGMHCNRWEKTIIQQDIVKYSGTFQDFAALSAIPPANTSSESENVSGDSTGTPAAAFGQDMEQEESSSDISREHGPSFSIYRCSALPVNFPPQTMDGEVELSQLGDVASTLDAAL
ncbi:hypothetical protein FKP32DRAFT_1562141, partial [Trametes sanguinea]